MTSKAIIAAALLCGATAASTLAATRADEGASFTVRVALQNDRGSDIGLCRANQSIQASSVQAIVRCTPAPAPDPGTLRTVASALLFHVSRGGEWLGTVDEPLGAGTVTSWRVIRLADRDYLEMTVGW